MLSEAPNVQQIDGEPHRRWFSDEFFDLIVWFHPDASILGFQLCYGVSGDQRALTWTLDAGYDHTRVDDGDSFGGGGKRTPILTAAGPFDPEPVTDRFQGACGDIERRVADFVLKKLQGY